MDKNTRKLREKVQERWNHLESLGYKVIFVGLYGSQNYGLDDEGSDIDVKAIVLPTLKDLMTRRSISKVYELEDGLTEVKDLASYSKIITKGNPAFIEPFHSKYKMGNIELINLFSSVEVNLHAALGMVCQKRELIKKGNGTDKQRKEIGYDPKNFHHIVRLAHIIEDPMPFHFYKKGTVEHRVILSYKRGGYLSKKYFVETNRESALAVADEIIEYSKEVLKGYRYTPNLDIVEEATELSIKLMKMSLFNDYDDLAARQVRTFGGNVPKVDRNQFPILEERNGEDFTYIVYSYLEIL